MKTEKEKLARLARIEALSLELLHAENSGDLDRVKAAFCGVIDLRREIDREAVRGPVLSHPAPPRMPHKARSEPPPGESAAPLLALRLAWIPAPSPALVSQMIDLGVVALHGLRPGGA